MEVGQLASSKNAAPPPGEDITNQTRKGNDIDRNQGRRLTAEEKLRVVM